jgi:hypothetical protein
MRVLQPRLNTRFTPVNLLMLNISPSTATLGKSLCSKVPSAKVCSIFSKGIAEYLVHIFAENNVFQFFVRATDKGSPSLSSDLPVELLIMDPEDVAPVFERRDDKFFITEYSQPGNSSC